MNCVHGGRIAWDKDTEEWFCTRCGEVFDEPPEYWDDEDIKQAKEDGV